MRYQFFAFSLFAWVTASSVAADAGCQSRAARIQNLEQEFHRMMRSISCDCDASSPGHHSHPHPHQHAHPHNSHQYGGQPPAIDIMKQIVGGHGAHPMPWSPSDHGHAPNPTIPSHNPRGYNAGPEAAMVHPSSIVNTVKGLAEGPSSMVHPDSSCAKKVEIFYVDPAMSGGHMHKPVEPFAASGPPTMHQHHVQQGQQYDSRAPFSPQSMYRGLDSFPQQQQQQHHQHQHHHQQHQPPSRSHPCRGGAPFEQYPSHSLGSETVVTPSMAAQYPTRPDHVGNAITAIPALPQVDSFGDAVNSIPFIPAQVPISDTVSQLPLVAPGVPPPPVTSGQALLLPSVEPIPPPPSTLPAPPAAKELPALEWKFLTRTIPDGPIKISYRERSVEELAAGSSPDSKYMVLINDNAGKPMLMSEARLDALKDSFNLALYMPNQVTGKPGALVHLGTNFLITTDEIIDYEPHVEFDNSPNVAVITHRGERYLWKFEEGSGFSAYDYLFQIKNFRLTFLPPDAATAPLVIKRPIQSGPIEYEGCPVLENGHGNAITHLKLHSHHNKIQASYVKEPSKTCELAITSQAAELIRYLISKALVDITQSVARERSPIPPAEWSQEVRETPSGQVTLRWRKMTLAEVESPDHTDNDGNSFHDGGEYELVVGDSKEAWAMSKEELDSYVQAFKEAAFMPNLDAARKGILGHYSKHCLFIIETKKFVPFLPIDVAFEGKFEEVLTVYDGQKYIWSTAPFDGFKHVLSLPHYRIRLPLAVSSEHPLYIEKTPGMPGGNFVGGDRILVDGVQSNQLKEIRLDPPTNVLTAKYVNDKDPNQVYTTTLTAAGSLFVQKFREFGLLNVILAGATGSDPNSWTKLVREEIDGKIELAHRKRTDAEIRDLTGVSLDGRQGTGSGNNEVVINGNPKASLYVSDEALKSLLAIFPKGASAYLAAQKTGQKGAIGHFSAKWLVTYEKAMEYTFTDAIFEGNEAKMPVNAEGHIYVWDCGSVQAYADLFALDAFRITIPFMEVGGNPFVIARKEKNAAVTYEGPPLLFNGAEVASIINLELDDKQNTITAKYELVPDRTTTFRVAASTTEFLKNLIKLRPQDLVMLALKPEAPPSSTSSPKWEEQSRDFPDGKIKLQWRLVSQSELDAHTDFEGRTLVGTGTMEVVVNDAKQARLVEPNRIVELANIHRVNDYMTYEGKNHLKGAIHDLGKGIIITHDMVHDYPTIIGEYDGHHHDLVIFFLDEPYRWKVKDKYAPYRFLVNAGPFELKLRAPKSVPDPHNALTFKRLSKDGPVTLHGGAPIKNAMGQESNELKKMMLWHVLVDHKIKATYVADPSKTAQFDITSKSSDLILDVFKEGFKMDMKSTGNVFQKYKVW